MAEKDFSESVGDKKYGDNLSHSTTQNTISPGIQRSSFLCCSACVNPCMTKYNPLPDTSTFRQRLLYAFMCPAHGVVAEWCNLALVMFIIWAVLWSMTVQEALPGGNLFALLILVVMGILAGELVKKINLPPLLGYTCTIFFRICLYHSY